MTIRLHLFRVSSWSYLNSCQAQHTFGSQSFFLESLRPSSQVSQSNWHIVFQVTPIMIWAFEISLMKRSVSHPTMIYLNKFDDSISFGTSDLLSFTALATITLTVSSACQNISINFMSCAKLSFFLVQRFDFPCSMLHDLYTFPTYSSAILMSSGMYSDSRKDTNLIFVT